MSSSNLLDLSASNEIILMATVSSEILGVNTSNGVVSAVHSCEVALTNQIAIVIHIVFYLLPRLRRHLLADFSCEIYHFCLQLFYGNYLSIKYTQ